MKLRHALVVGTLLLAPLVHAAGPSSPPPGPGDMMGASPESEPGLDLTADQRTKVKAIWEEARAKHDAIRQAAHDKIAKVLTPEQMKRWEELRSDRVKRRAEHMERQGMQMEKRADRMQDRAQQMRDRAADK